MVAASARSNRDFLSPSERREKTWACAQAAGRARSVGGSVPSALRSSPFALRQPATSPLIPRAGIPERPHVLPHYSRPMSQYAKKHHFIPQFLLHHFAGPTGKLVAHQVMSGRRFGSAVRDLGHRNFGHSIYRPGHEPDHVSMEAAMGKIEDEAATVVRELVKGRERTVPAHARSALAWLLALQWQRSRFLMHVTGKASGVEGSGLSDEEVQTSMMGFISMYVIDPWRLRHDDDAYYKDQWNHLVSTLLSSDMHWSCYRPRKGGLLVGDNPVCFSGVVGPPPEDVPPGYFDHGVGVGFQNFRRLTLPLGSTLAVIISVIPRITRGCGSRTSTATASSIAVSSWRTPRTGPRATRTSPASFLICWSGSAWSRLLSCRDTPPANATRVRFAPGSRVEPDPTAPSGRTASANHCLVGPQDRLTGPPRRWTARVPQRPPQPPGNWRA